MKLPKRGQKGFTLIELLIVVAILGVLAAVVIPNVAGFIGAGETEAQETELSNIQAAVTTMMVDNEIAILPSGYVDGTTIAAIEDMSKFPHETSACGTVGQKVYDPDGKTYTATTDKDGYILYGHDIIADGLQTGLVNYVTTKTTAYWYSVDANGTVSQELVDPTP